MPTILLVIGSAMLGACGSDGDEPSARDQHAEHQAKQRADQRAKATETDMDMVVAPSTAKSPPAVALKFAITQKPEIGKPVDIRLAFVPTEGQLSVLGSFQASEGLEIVAGAKTPMYEKPAAGASIAHTITVVPRNDGILYVLATVVSDTDTTSVSRTFSIPLIAGEGLSASTQTANAATPAVANAPAAKSRQSQ
jgi:hypothetical protein